MLVKIVNENYQNSRFRFKFFTFDNFLKVLVTSWNIYAVNGSHGLLNVVMANDEESQFRYQGLFNG